MQVLWRKVSSTSLEHSPMPAIRPVFIVAALAVVLMLTTFFWYRGSGSPLTEHEINAYQTRIDALPAATRGFLQGMDVLAFMRGDDGRAVHVVNLFQLNTASAAPDSLSGEESLARFSRSMLPIWLKHGGYPVFSMPVAATGEAQPWEFVSVVRYRSRRDFMEVVLDEGYRQALPDRLAASKLNLRVTSSGNEFPRPLMLLFALSAAVLSFTYLLEVRRSKHAA